MIFVEMRDEDVEVFIRRKMIDVDAIVYNNSEFDVFFSLPHINVMCIENEHIYSFGCIAMIDGYNCMCYSWSDGSFKGKRSYIKGLRYLISKYNIVLDDGTLPNYIKKRI